MNHYTFNMENRIETEIAKYTSAICTGKYNIYYHPSPKCYNHSNMNNKYIAVFMGPQNTTCVSSYI